MHGRTGHMRGGTYMMNEKMLEMMSKEDLMMMYTMKLDKKIAIMEVKLDYLKKMRDMLKDKM
jgi:RAB protein geranylgeranyltransferase component A